MIMRIAASSGPPSARRDRRRAISASSASWVQRGPPRPWPGLTVVRRGAVEGLYHRRAIDRMEHLLGHLFANVPVDIQRFDDAVRDLLLHRQERIGGRRRRPLGAGLLGPSRNA